MQLLINLVNEACQTPSFPPLSHADTVSTAQHTLLSHTLLSHTLLSHTLSVMARPASAQTTMGQFFGPAAGAGKKKPAAQPNTQWGALLDQPLLAQVSGLRSLAAGSSDRAVDALCRNLQARPQPYVSEHYKSVFTDRRCPGAGSRNGTQPYPRLDPVRCYNWKGSQAALRRDVGAETNLDAVVRGVVHGAGATDAAAGTLLGYLGLGRDDRMLLAAVFYGAAGPCSDAVWLAKLTPRLAAGGLLAHEAEAAARSLVSAGWLAEGAAPDDLDAWSGLLRQLPKSTLGSVAKHHRLPAGDTARTLVSCLRAIAKNGAAAKMLRKEAGPILRLADRHRHDLQRAHAVFFMSRGYNCDDACSLLRQRLVSFRFVSDACSQEGTGVAGATATADATATYGAGTGAGAGAGAGAGGLPSGTGEGRGRGHGHGHGTAAEPGRAEARLRFGELCWRAAVYVGRLEEAAAAGATERAYEVMHEASSMLLELVPAPASAALGQPAGHGHSAANGGGGVAWCWHPPLQEQAGRKSASGGCVLPRGPMPLPATDPAAEIVHALATVLCETILRGVALFEREKRYQEARHYLGLLLPRCPSHELWELAAARFAMDLNHTGALNQALGAYEAVLAGPGHTLPRGASMLAAQRACVRLSVPPRRWKKPKFNPPATGVVKKLTASRGDEGRGWVAAPGVGGSRSHTVHSVEAYVLDVFQRDTDSGPAWEGMHAENGVWITLTGILVLDLLWPAPGGGGGQGPRAPAQTHQDTCYELRAGAFLPATAKLLHARLAELRTPGKAASLLERNWRTYHGVQAHGIDWARLPAASLCAIITGLPAAAVAAITEALVLNYAEWGGASNTNVLARRHMPVQCVVVVNPVHCAHTRGSETGVRLTTGNGDLMHRRHAAGVHTR